VAEATKAVACLKCRRPLPWTVFNAPGPGLCPSCFVDTEVTVFPAFVRPPAVADTGERLQAEGEASCFYHPQKRAVLACDRCGRFLCALCDISFRHEHVCPGCLETARTRKKSPDLENRRMLYDEIALGLAIVPLLFFWISLLTAPVALYYVIRYWRAPTSLLPRWSKTRFVCAGLLALLQLAVWCFVFGTLWFGVMA